MTGPTTCLPRLGSGFGGFGLEVDDFLMLFSSIQAGRDCPEFAKGLESLGGECGGAASLIDVLEILKHLR